VQHSVREFIALSADALAIPIRWEGTGVDEKGLHGDTGQVIVEVDPRYFRPTEVETLLGDPTKARTKLGWEPRISLDALVAEMVERDLEQARKDQLCQRHGFTTCDYKE
jgi:GDPmannose 4,6-dehydratase